MPAVFVHGVPDTPEVWDGVVCRLGRKDVVRLALPGFACPLPLGFGATKEEYVDWILGQLATLTGPIDLVGHDWGGLLVTRVVSVRPTVARSWAVGAAPLDREYVWHQAARAWQTPGMGEKVWRA
jgi:pimeloyl-ACP methyl ester carboxylesterase